MATDQVNPGTPVPVPAPRWWTAPSSGRNDAQVVAHVTNAGGATRDVPLEWAVNQDGEYRATFTPDEQGLLTHPGRSDVAGRRSTPAFDSTFVRVADLNTEFVNAEMRADLLQRIADETGGRFYTPANVSTLPQTSR